MSTPAQEQKASMPTIEEKIAAVDINANGTTNGSLDGSSKESEKADINTESQAADGEVIKGAESKVAHSDEQSKEKPGVPAAEEVKAANAAQPSSSPAVAEKPSGPIKKPFTGPLPTSKPIPAPELDTSQQTKYNTLLEVVRAWKQIPAKDGKGGPITDDEIMWLTRDCILRYLRATKWSVKDAEKRLLGTLAWRREYGVEALTGDYISPENETGKQLILGFDNNARPCQYLNPGLQNTQGSTRQVQHLVFMVERTIDLMVPGQETLALLINFKSGGARFNTAPPISQGREVLNILQTHYPERMGRALIINVPWVVWGFFKLITPFIDPLTKDKLKFNEKVREYVPPEQLWKEFQGDCDFVYDHETYWPALLKLCEERRLEQKARWEKAGKHIGEHEAYLKGADVPSAFPASA